MPLLAYYSQTYAGLADIPMHQCESADWALGLWWDVWPGIYQGLF